jgi:hypothetical protein
VFPVRCELNSYILFRRNSVFKGLKYMFECAVVGPDAVTTPDRDVLERWVVAR